MIKNILKGQVHFHGAVIQKVFFFEEIFFSVEWPLRFLCEQGVLYQYYKFYRKTPALQFIKKRLKHSYFHVNFAKFLKTPILKIFRERLLLSSHPMQHVMLGMHESTICVIRTYVMLGMHESTICVIRTYVASLTSLFLECNK